jgi:hypothetical protein
VVGDRGEEFAEVRGELVLDGPGFCTTSSVSNRRVRKGRGRGDAPSPAFSFNISRSACNSFENSPFFRSGFAGAMATPELPAPKLAAEGAEVEATVWTAKGKE